MKNLTENEAIALCSPYPYVLVTSLDKKEKPNAMGASWVSRVSFNPFLMMVSIDRSRYSHEGINAHREFVVHYPTDEQATAAWFCGTKSGRIMDKISVSGLELAESVHVKVPTIRHCLAAFECRVVDMFEAGDHTLFIGKVVAIRGNPQKARHIFATGDNGFMALEGR